MNEWFSSLDQDVVTWSLWSFLLLVAIFSLRRLWRTHYTDNLAIGAAAVYLAILTCVSYTGGRYKGIDETWSHCVDLRDMYSNTIETQARTIADYEEVVPELQRLLDDCTERNVAFRDALNYCRAREDANPCPDELRTCEQARNRLEENLGHCTDVAMRQSSEYEKKCEEMMEGCR